MTRKYWTMGWSRTIVPWTIAALSLMAVLIDVAAQQDLDYGDAPDPKYPTFRSNQGARHGVNPELRLGATVDDEADGQPTSDGLGETRYPINNVPSVKMIPPDTLPMLVSFDSARFRIFFGIVRGTC